jgi:hypothetical protein
MRAPCPKSRCALCSRTYQKHEPLHCGTALLCPDDSGRVFTPRRTTVRAAQSFSAREIDLLAEVLDSVANHRPLYQLTKRRELGTVARKVRSMKAGVVGKEKRA